MLDRLRGKTFGKRPPDRSNIALQVTVKINNPFSILFLLFDFFIRISVFWKSKRSFASLRMTAEWPCGVGKMFKGLTGKRREVKGERSFPLLNSDSHDAVTLVRYSFGPGAIVLEIESGEAVEFLRLGNIAFEKPCVG